MATPLYDALVHEYRSALRCVPGDHHHDRLTAATAGVSHGLGAGIGMDMRAGLGGPSLAGDMAAIAAASAAPAGAAAETTMLRAVDVNGGQAFDLADRDADFSAIAGGPMAPPPAPELGVVPYPRRANGVPRQVSRHRGASGDGPGQSPLL